MSYIAINIITLYSHVNVSVHIINGINIYQNVQCIHIPICFVIYIDTIYLFLHR